jgi:hypothetical protein
LVLVELSFNFIKEYDQEDAEDIIYSLFGSLSKNGQLLGDDPSNSDPKYAGRR